MASLTHPTPNGSHRRSKPASQLAAWRELTHKPPARLLIFSALSTIWFLIIVVRLWDLQVLQAERLTEKAHRQHETSIEIRAARGAIYDRLGEELALSTPVDSIGVIPSKVRNRQLTASMLGEVLRLDPQVILSKLGQDRFQWIKRLAEPGEAERIRHAASAPTIESCDNCGCILVPAASR